MDSSSVAFFVRKGPLGGGVQASVPRDKTSLESACGNFQHQPRGGNYSKINSENIILCK